MALFQKGKEEPWENLQGDLSLEGVSTNTPGCHSQGHAGGQGTRKSQLGSPRGQWSQIGMKPSGIVASCGIEGSGDAL